MAGLKHLFPIDITKTEQYVYPHEVRGAEFKLPPRDNRVGHGTKLISELREAEKQALEKAEGKTKESRPKGIVVDFESEPGFKLKLESLELRKSKIELLNSRVVNGVMHATVFIPDRKVEIFIRKFEAYCHENNKKSGKAKHKDLVESINTIRLAILESFWTDREHFPNVKNRPIWWEVWLRGTGNSKRISDQFRVRAKDAGIEVSTREIRFPERLVLLARATIDQWIKVENLFDMLAELRLAKTLAGVFLELPPRIQAEFVEDARRRITPPSIAAPSVCHLDTGVNRAHPLLELAILPEHVLTVNSDWSRADLVGHGTEMAGLSLYGCLTGLLESTDPFTLGHRLEAVKILPDRNANDPDLYGEITAQAVSRVEIAANERTNRAFCLAVTTLDSRDEGYPSSWSGDLDQICSGALEYDGLRRLFFVSAGNTPRDGRHDYPNHNHLHGVVDPSQSWNAITVGAFTERAFIKEADVADWTPIAEPGRLSPSSRTSIIWSDKAWPLKPDIVMEGGNQAIDPSSKKADYLDDLSLLTTCVSPDGALLTTTGDTSAATALAARYGAIIWAYYPNLWPETVRGLLVHSAKWTDAMLEEFPKKERHNRLRCYGYGVPDLQKALWSASNAATLIVEASLQPYQMDGTSGKTKDMHLHRLPWPLEVLRELGDADVRMRVTLSYFVEPSPGRIGWTKKHRYQSYGLRFDVKRPLDEDDSVFLDRITKSTWNEDTEEIDFGEDNRNWEIGTRLRCKGSIHSDTWTGYAVELAKCNAIAIFPVTGWWRERPHLDCGNRIARYSLIVTIETPATDVNIYTPIANMIKVPVPIELKRHR